MKPGIHTIAAADYHQDVTDEPSLSASIAAVMCNRSPLHAWHRHPRLNPDFERVDEQKFDVGTAAHAMLLEGHNIVGVIDAADWRTNAAKDQRDEHRAAGRIPLLVHQFEQVYAMVKAVRSQLDALDIAPQPFTDGKPEQTLVWQDRGVWCRARLDWLRDDHQAIDDLKSTAGSAHPGEWSQRHLWGIGADVQYAFYVRGLRALTGIDAAFRWVVTESTPPYALSVVTLAPNAIALANQKIEWALATWRRCLDTGHWPGYIGQIAHAETPPWVEMKWLEARQLDELAEAS